MAGPSNPRTGAHIFPGYFTSAAGAAGSWPLWITGPAVPGASVQAFFGNAFFGRVVEEIPAPGVWDSHRSISTRTWRLRTQRKVQTFNATDTDLRAFRKQNHKGKIIIWHGWEDPAISALSTVNYFRQVVRGNDDDASNFIRLFMAPGMTHCGGGPGPNAFGRVAAAGDAPQPGTGERHPQRTGALGTSKEYRPNASWR